MADILDEIIQIPFSENQYYKATYPKDQIVLHHTVSNGSAMAVADYWESTARRVGTCIVLDKEGVIHQLFSSRYYAGHVGNVSDEMNLIPCLRQISFTRTSSSSGVLHRTTTEKFLRNSSSSSPV